MSSDEPATYAIRVRGVIGPEWVDRLGGMHVRQLSAGGQPTTELVGDLVDQTALAGVLSTLFDLGLPIMSVGRLAESPPQRGLKGRRTSMSDLIVVAYDEERTAQEVLRTLERLQTDQLIDLEDAAYVTRDEHGDVQLHNVIPLGAAGAVRGAFWGTLIGFLVFTPLVGLAVGAGAGYLIGKRGDVGIDDKLAKRLGEKLQPETSALLLLVHNVTADKVLPEVAKYGGEVLQTSLPADAEERLKAALMQPEQ